jgi:RimJ/RimL family protein N-acetyltransferase
MASFGEKPTIHGTRVGLRPLEAADADHMWADLQDPEGLEMTGTHATFTRDQVAAWCATRSGEQDRLDLAIVDAATSGWLGEIVLNDWDRENRSCSLRIAVTAGARGRGVGTEATQLLVGYAFTEIDDPPVHRIGLEVHDFNHRAVRLYERVGFRREGVLRDALHWDGCFHEAIVMSMLRTDHPPAAV